MLSKVKTGALAANVVNTGTVAIDYPRDTNLGDFYGAVGHSIMVKDTLYSSPADISLSFGATQVTITNNSGGTWLAGSLFRLELMQPGAALFEGLKRSFPVTSLWANIGAPKTADADGIVASQAITLATGLATGINGALASGGAAVLDVARNIVAGWTGAAVLTVTGEDEYGVAMTESSASGVAMTGKKAFKKVTGVTVSADVTAATVGTGDVLGLPFFLTDSDFILKEMQDAAVPTAGTFVAGVGTTPSATTGDVRGTYDPNVACDGAKSFRLLIATPDPDYLGLTQA